MDKFKVWLKDTAERAISAFVLAFLVAFPLDNLDKINTDLLGKAAIAGALAGAVVLKSALASFFGNRSSASLVPDLPKEQVTADPKVGDPLFQDPLAAAAAHMGEGPDMHEGEL